MSLSASNAGFNVQPSLSEPVNSGLQFQPTWVFENDGTVSWQPSFTFRFVSTPGGETNIAPHNPTPSMRSHAQLAPKVSYTLAELGVSDVIQPGTVLSLTIPDMQTPDAAGDYISHWQLHSADGQPFGPRRWVSPTVKEDEPDPVQPTPVKPKPPLPVKPAQSKEFLSNGVGITLSHVEFDVDQLDDKGHPISDIQVEGSLRMNYTELLGKFDVLRFMNWQKTNVHPNFIAPFGTLAEFNLNNQDNQWLEKKRIIQKASKGSKDPFSGAWTESGAVPLKVCLEMAKTVGVHPWINVPHGNSLQDFDAIMKEIVRFTLDELVDTGLKPIFEFSNEVWNDGTFGQHRACANLARREASFDLSGIGDFNIPIAWQVMCTNRLKRYVGDRGYVVLGAQANQPDLAGRLLGIDNFEIGVFGKNKLGNHNAEILADAIAIAPYFGNARRKDHLTAGNFPHGFHPLKQIQTGQQFDPSASNAIELLHDNLMLYVNGSDIGGETREMMQRHRMVLDQYHSERGGNELYLWAYEGGPDLNYNARDYSGFDQQAVNELFAAYLHDNRSKTLMEAVMTLWNGDGVGGGLFVSYSSATNYSSAKDQFGYIDVSETEAESRIMRYRATPRLSALIK